MRTRANSRRGTGDRGAVVVELAVSGLVFATLLFGVIEFGLAFGDYNSVRQGTRDAAREAAVNNIPTPTSCTAGGTGAQHNLICLVQSKAGLTDDSRLHSKVCIYPAGTSTGTSTCSATTV